jgi:chromosome segregation ATPase
MKATMKSPMKMVKKSVAASPAKKASQQNKKQQEKVAKKKQQQEDSAEEEEEKPQKTEQQEARSAANEVARKKGFIKRLEAAREAIVEKMKERVKDYNKQIRAAEKELEDLEDKAKTKGKAAAKVQKIAQMAKAAHLAAKLEEKANRVAVGRLQAAKALKAAKERKEQLSASLEQRKGKASEYKAVFERAQKEYDSALKQCKELKKQGDFVPDEGWKDYSAPFAYKPPGVRAFMDMTAAKEKWAKAKAVWDRLSEDMQQREERAKAAVDRVKEVQQRRKAVEERKEQVDSALTGVLKKLKPSDKLRIKESQGALKKVIKIHKKRN